MKSISLEEIVKLKEEYVKPELSGKKERPDIRSFVFAVAKAQLAKDEVECQARIALLVEEIEAQETNPYYIFLKLSDWGALKAKYMVGCLAKIEEYQVRIEQIFRELNEHNTLKLKSLKGTPDENKHCGLGLTMHDWQEIKAKYMKE